MKTIGLCVLAAALCIPHLAIGQDNRPRTSDGTVMDLTGWRSIPPHEFMLNIVDLPNVTVMGAQRRVRDKGVPHERIYFDGGDGWIQVEHLFVRVYHGYITDRFKSGEYADRLAEAWWKHRGESFEVLDRRKVYSYGERAGWVYATRGRASGTSCIIASFGLLSDWAKMGQRTEEHFDTGVRIRDCAGKRSLTEVAGWVEGAKIVEPPYNRVR